MAIILAAGVGLALTLFIVATLGRLDQMSHELEELRATSRLLGQSGEIVARAVKTMQDSKTR